MAAVCNAGGFGILQAQSCPPPVLRAQITHLRALTDKPFGVNFILHLPHRDGVELCLEERVAALSFFWGNPAEFVAPAHAAGLAVIHQVGSVAAAVRSCRAGVDVIIAQGVEAGGHVAGTVSTMALVPRIVDAVAPTLVLAATEEDTVRTILFGHGWPNAPHRTLRTPFVDGISASPSPNAGRLILALSCVSSRSDPKTECPA